VVVSPETHKTNKPLLFPSDEPQGWNKLNSDAEPKFQEFRHNNIPWIGYFLMVFTKSAIMLQISGTAAAVWAQIMESGQTNITIGPSQIYTQERSGTNQLGGSVGREINQTTETYYSTQYTLNSPILRLWTNTTTKKQPVSTKILLHISMSQMKTNSTKIRSYSCRANSDTETACQRWHGKSLQYSLGSSSGFISGGQHTLSYIIHWQQPIMETYTNTWHGRRCWRSGTQSSRCNLQ